MSNEVDVVANRKSTTIVLTENRFEAVRFLNNFLEEDTWFGVRNFVDTGNGAGSLKEMNPFFGQAVIDDSISTRHKHMDTKSNPSKKMTDALFYIRPSMEFASYPVWAPFQIQYDMKRDAMYVLTKLNEVSTIYVFAHGAISLLSRKRANACKS